MMNLLRARAAGLGRVLLAWARTPERAEDERTILAGEASWAAAVASGEVGAIERLLAEDFLGIAPDGSFTDKAGELEELRRGAGRFLSNRLNEVRVRVYGDTAIAQGSESWEQRTGEPRYGRYVWTDTWLRRDGRWQLVAAEDLTVTEAAPLRD